MNCLLSMNTKMGSSLLLKYVIATLLVVTLWCSVQFWTADEPRPAPGRSFDSRDVEMEDFTHRWMEERGFPELEINETLQNKDKNDGVDKPTCDDNKSPNDRFVIFNVLPKSGSRTLYSLALNVGKRHGVDVQNTMALTNETKSEKIGRLLEDHSAATFVYSHLHYVDFNSTERNVVYISIVRDPIERLVSLYYYKRYGDSTEPGLFREKMDRLNLSRDTFDECVKRNGDCINSNLLEKTISHFCGIDSEKSSATGKYCATEAKRNVRNKYLVVGVMEDYDGFIKVLERLLPDVFQGATDFYNTFKTQHYFQIMKTKNKTGPSERVARELRKRMAKEYEFYEYVKREFELLKNKLGID
ncbi:heparan sulfate 2-O-sulfotransferase 1-like [Apostichopus japonicus]|uniref:heparan sulfate 2-O-sulfotransferase 1-like n=1 Tax=Stichopus japonicus TaxID=307972 RepID=UPI003AB3CF57